MIIEDLIEYIQIHKPFLIGVCGIPGAGKTYISQKIKNKINNCVVIPMDGFHIYRQ
jgi:uridine kinase